MLEDVPELDTLIVPIGGGGLLTGMGTAARGIKNDMRLIGVQAELYPSMYAELNGVDMACEGDTLAEGIAVKEPGAYTRSEEHTSELQSLMRISYAVFCLYKNSSKQTYTPTQN